MARQTRAKMGSQLARVRVLRGVSQERMAKAIGVSLRTYRRLENGEIADPGIRLLHNCAIALAVPLNDIIEAEWEDWTVFSDDAKETPYWPTFFKPGAVYEDYPEKYRSYDMSLDPPATWAEWNEELLETARAEWAELYPESAQGQAS